MAKIRTLAALTGALACVAAPASAGVYADDMAKCIVRSASAADQRDLVIWIFAAIGQHPDVRPYSTVTPAQLAEINRKTASLFQRLVVDDCHAESVAALKYEGPTALQAAFGVLGEVAMRSLMNHTDVDKATSGLGESVDVKKLQALFKEAGITIPEDEKK